MIEEFKVAWHSIPSIRYTLIVTNAQHISACYDLELHLALASYYEEVQYLQMIIQQVVRTL